MSTVAVPRPEVAPPEAWAFPLPDESVTVNGIRLLSYAVPGQYVISLRLVVPLSLTDEPPELEGVNTQVHYLATGATTGRGLGVLEMARAIRAGVPHRAQGEIAAHVLDIMVGIETAITESTIVQIESTFTEVEPMPADFDPLAATLAGVPADA